VVKLAITEHKKDFKHRRGAESAKKTYIAYKELSKKILVTALEVFWVKRRATVVLSLLKP
jgi:hypothetical protein